MNKDITCPDVHFKLFHPDWRKDDGAYEGCFNCMAEQVKNLQDKVARRNLQIKDLQKTLYKQNGWIKDLEKEVDKFKTLNFQECIYKNNCEYAVYLNNR
jgi:pectin methylesterase-like acyl-CoA thioesterase